VTALPSLDICESSSVEARNRLMSTMFGNVAHDDLSDQWQQALGRYKEMDLPIAKFNTALILALRPSWEHRVRIVTSMFRLLFVHPGSTKWPFNEQVVVEYEKSKDRVSVSLNRDAPRRGDPRPVGGVVVAGDFVRPENAIPVVESFLVQIASQDP